MLGDSFLIPLCFLRGSYARLALTVGALAAGVALVCAIELVNRSVLSAFEEVIDTMAGRAALQIGTAGGGSFREEVAETACGVAGVELAVPTVWATAFVADGSGELLTVYGVDITNDAAVRVYKASDARGIPLEDPLAFLNDPGAVLLTREFAGRRGLRIGDRIELETPIGRQRFTIHGLLEPEGIGRVHGGNLVVMDILAAEERFTRAGFVNRVDVVVERDADVTEVKRAIAALLPPGLEVERRGQRKADLNRVMRSMHVVLRAVGLLALAAAFLIAFNRLATLFDERAWQHGVLRAVGARRRAVWWELLKEGFILGACGVALGIPIGIGLARVLLPAIATTTALNAKLLVPDAALALRGWALALAGTLGLLTALLAAVRPAWRAAQVQVADTLRNRGVEHPTARDGAMRIARGAILAAALASVVVALPSRSPISGLLASAGRLLAVALSARPLLDSVATPLKSGSEKYTACGFFAVAALTRNPRRTALTVATLGVGFAGVVWIWVLARVSSAPSSGSFMVFCAVISRSARLIAVTASRRIPSTRG